jgi:transcriptional regulator of acetoin/glycerol metabolism
MQKEIKNIPKQVIEELMRYSWPGNVRELEHIIERAVIISQGANLQLGEALESPEPEISEDHMITDLAEVEKRHILKILEKKNWRIDGPKGAAILLGLHPNTLRGKMRKLDIRPQKTPLL